MRRLDRANGVLPGSLEGAADELQASLERYLRELLSAAQARASELEDRATRKAFAAGAGAATAEGAARMMEAIDLIDRRVAESLRSLRAEARKLLAELEKIRPESRNGEKPRDDGWTEGLDEEMARLLFLDDLPE